MPLQQVINYDDINNFSVNPNEVKQNGAAIQTKDDRPAGATFYTDFADDSKDADWGDGVLTGTLRNVAVVQNSKLELPGGAGTRGSVEYDALANATTGNQKGTVRMLWIPQYNGAGTFNAQQLFAIGLDGGPINVIALVHFKSGGANLNFSAADSAGVSMGSINFGTFNAVAGTEYEVEINYDFTSGDVRLFIDGVQFGGLGNLTGVRTNNIDKIRIGDSMDLNVVGPEFHSKWLALFDTVQHTGNYTPIGALLTVLLFPAETSVLHNAGQLMDRLLNLAETDVNVPAGSSLKYIMQVDGIDMWFDGANWSASNGLAVEANTLVLHPDHLLVFCCKSVRYVNNLNRATSFPRRSEPAEIWYGHLCKRSHGLL